MSLHADYTRVMMPVYAPAPKALMRGDGARLTDEDGKDYIDFGGGVAVISLGHGAPEISAAICEQSRQLMHTSNLFVTEPAVRLAKMLIAHTFADRVFFCNSGAEANEAALKLARRRGVAIRAGKYKVLSFSGAFHGRLGMAMAATPQPKVRDGFGPLTPGFVTAPFNDAAAAAAQMDDDFCAIIVEPVQGESGVHPADDDFLRALRELASRHDAALIFDEVQSGNGRTGALYAYMNSGVVPNIMTTAKGLGGGAPIGAMLARDDVAAAMGAGAHGTTYGGNPLATRAAEAVLRAIVADGFLDGVGERAAIFAGHLRALNDKFGCFAQVRQAGLLVGCDMADGWRATAARDAAFAHGVIVITAGDNALRFAPPLNIPPPQITVGFARLAAALTTLR